MATISRCDSGDFTVHFRSAGSLGRIVALPVTLLLVLDFTDTAFIRLENHCACAFTLRYRVDLNGSVDKLSQLSEEP